MFFKLIGLKLHKKRSFCLIRTDPKFVLDGKTKYYLTIKTGNFGTDLDVNVRLFGTRGVCVQSDLDLGILEDNFKKNS